MENLLMFWVKREGVFLIREGEKYFCLHEFLICRGIFSEVML